MSFYAINMQYRSICSHLHVGYTDTFPWSALVLIVRIESHVHSLTQTAEIRIFIDREDIAAYSEFRQTLVNKAHKIIR